jgi:Putative auto-transporter adhesin, head GIN domain
MHLAPFTRSPARRSAALLLVAALVAVPAAMFSTPAHADEGGINWSWGNAQRVVGSGKVATETRKVEGFQAVSLRSQMNVTLRQGTREGLELQADDNLLPLIEARVVDRDGVPTLELGVKKGVNLTTRHALAVTIDLQTLRAVSIAGSGEVQGDALKVEKLAIAVTGSGDIRLKQLTAAEVAAKVSGSGDVVLAGRSAKLSVSIAGSGDVDTHALEVDEVSVSIAGSGDANVNARKTLSVTIAGSGDVKYSGEATVKSSIAGSGRITKQ